MISEKIKFPVLIVLLAIFQQSMSDPVVFNFRPVEPEGISGGMFRVLCKLACRYFFSLYLRTPTKV